MKGENEVREKKEIENEVKELVDSYETVEREVTFLIREVYTASEEKNLAYIKWDKLREDLNEKCEERDRLMKTLNLLTKSIKESLMNEKIEVV